MPAACSRVPISSRARVRRVRVARAPDHQQLALDLLGAGERAGVGVRAELAVVQAGRVPARGRADLRANAARNARCPPVQCPAAPSDPFECSASHPSAASMSASKSATGVASASAWPAHLALVVEAEHGPGRLDAVVDLGHGDEEAVAGQPHRPAQRRLGELEDVGVEDDAGMRPARARRGDERAHPARVDPDLDVLARDDHARILSHGGDAGVRGLTGERQRRLGEEVGSGCRWRGCAELS